MVDLLQEGFNWCGVFAV